MVGRFLVPQFIDVESKIIGPITVRQFVIMLVAGGIIFLEYKLADFTLFVAEGLATFGIFGVFAFLRVNGQPFHKLVVDWFYTLSRPKIRVWSKEDSFSKQKKTSIDVNKGEMIFTPKERIVSSRLAELSLVVNTGGVYRGEDIFD